MHEAHLGVSAQGSTCGERTSSAGLSAAARRGRASKQDCRLDDAPVTGGREGCGREPSGGGGQTKRPGARGLR
jgi:hypothetical protein